MDFHLLYLFTAFLELKLFFNALKIILILNINFHFNFNFKLNPNFNFKINFNFVILNLSCHLVFKENYFRRPNLLLFRFSLLKIFWQIFLDDFNLLSWFYLDWIFDFINYFINFYRFLEIFLVFMINLNLFFQSFILFKKNHYWFLNLSFNKSFINNYLKYSKIKINMNSTLIFSLRRFWMV